MLIASREYETTELHGIFFEVRLPVRRLNQHSLQQAVLILNFLVEKQDILIHASIAANLAIGDKIAEPLHLGPGFPQLLPVPRGIILQRSD